MWDCFTVIVHISKRYQKNCGWPFECKSLSIYIFYFILSFIYFYHFTTWNNILLFFLFYFFFMRIHFTQKLNYWRCIQQSRGSQICPDSLLLLREDHLFSYFLFQMSVLFLYSLRMSNLPQSRISILTRKFHMG